MRGLCPKEYRLFLASHREEVERDKEARLQAKKAAPLVRRPSVTRQATSRAAFEAASQAAALSSPPRASLDSVPSKTAVRELSLGLPVHHLDRNSGDPVERELYRLQEIDERIRAASLPQVKVPGKHSGPLVRPAPS